VLTAAGREMLAASPLLPANRASLLEAATHAASFQPRFAQVRLVGTANGSSLPPSDANGLADPYVTLRLVSPDGVVYPLGGVHSRTRYRTLRPRWGQTLEMALRGGAIGADGVYRNSETSGTKLAIQVHDADFGVWGWLMLATEVLGVTFGVVALAAYISGRSDQMTDLQARAAGGIVCFLAFAFAVSYMKYVLFRGDDDPMGVAEVPLATLLDGKPHQLRVSLATYCDSQEITKAAGDTIIKAEQPGEPTVPQAPVIEVVVICSER